MKKIIKAIFEWFKEPAQDPWVCSSCGGIIDNIHPLRMKDRTYYSCTDCGELYYIDK